MSKVSVVDQNRLVVQSVNHRIHRGNDEFCFTVDKHGQNQTRDIPRPIQSQKTSANTVLYIINDLWEIMVSKPRKTMVWRKCAKHRVFDVWTRIDSLFCAKQSVFEIWARVDSLFSAKSVFFFSEIWTRVYSLFPSKNMFLRYEPELIVYFPQNRVFCLTSCGRQSRGSVGL